MIVLFYEKKFKFFDLLNLLVVNLVEKNKNKMGNKVIIFLFNIFLVIFDIYFFLN